MPATRTYKTPGVYVAELSSFPPSIVGVETAVPAFVGYTERAEIDGKPAYNKAIRIGSLADFEQIFGGAQHNILNIADADAESYDFRVAGVGEETGWSYYSLTTDAVETDAPARVQCTLYNSMRLFYANGGGNCYVVSVGAYPDNPDGIKKEDLLKGLKVVEEQVGPTMLVVPDAVLLADEDAFGDVAKAMLAQCQALQDRVAILDVWGTEDLPPAGESSLDDVIEGFRAAVGSEGLSYGMSYFPFVQSSVVPLDTATYTNVDLAGSDASGSGLLQQILTAEANNLYPGEPNKTRREAVIADINKIRPNGEAPDGTTVRSLNDNLTASLPLLKDILRLAVAKQELLPPSGAMAGVFTHVDTTRGVWNAPANVTLASVRKPSFPLNNAQQGDLNVPVDGKAVDALREFPGRGTVVWGARTLDGNSNDYRYIQVRRTLIYIEQSIKNSLDPFVFAPNTGQTWSTVVSMVSAFLQNLWSQGGLMGATASEAFSVQCGLGSTMTGNDVLEGYMIVQVTLQLIRPAEFIELTFKQKMEGVS